MGRQYGYLLKGPMGDFYQIALQNLKMNHSRIKTISDFIYNNNNKYMQEFISGMAETS